MPAPSIIADGLVKRFGDTIAVNDVSLEVQPGTVLGLLGPNGAGKTTTVRMLATLLLPDAGGARVGGYDVRSQAHQVRQMIGLTGQYASVDEKLTGQENLVLIGRLLGLSRRAAAQRARALLARFHLEDAAHKAAKAYSGGMRRRLDLAASLVGEPKILFLDEPTTGLDPRARLELWSLINELVNDGTTVLLTTQYLEEADHLANDIVVIDQGRVIASGTPDQLKARIGGQTLVVKARSAPELERVRQLAADLLPEGTESEGLQLSAPVSSPDLLPTLVRRLDEAGIVPTELLLRHPSLDDVFLALTGHHAETTTGEQEEHA